jgi:hypothetical protein
MCSLVLNDGSIRVGRAALQVQVYTIMSVHDEPGTAGAADGRDRGLREKLGRIKQGRGRDAACADTQWRWHNSPDLRVGSQLMLCKLRTLLVALSRAGSATHR